MVTQLEPQPTGTAGAYPLTGIAGEQHLAGGSVLDHERAPPDVRRSGEHGSR